MSNRTLISAIAATVALWATFAHAEERGTPFTLSGIDETLSGIDEGWFACQSPSELYVLAAVQVHNWGALTNIPEPSDCTRIRGGTKLELLERVKSQAQPMFRDDIIRVRVPDDYSLPREMSARDRVWMRAAAFDDSEKGVWAAHFDPARVPFLAQ
jgi:hypothetical protein